MSTMSIIVLIFPRHSKEKSMVRVVAFDIMFRKYVTPPSFPTMDASSSNRVCYLVFTFHNLLG